MVDIAPLNRVIAAPAAAIYYLLVGQYGLVSFAPIDLGLLLVGQALVEHAGKKPLFPAVVVGVTGGKLPVPVIGKAQSLQLDTHVVDVFGGPAGGGHIVLNGRVLGGQAERVPAHGLQHIFAQHTLVAGDDIANGVVAHVTHVQLAAGVGKHGQAVEFFPPVVSLDGETVAVQPVFLDRLLNVLRGVSGVHYRACFRV